MKKSLRSKLDKLWGQKIHERGRCEICDSTRTLQAHHIYGRRNGAVRWYVPNGCLLCAGCHKFSQLSAHESPLWFAEKILELRGQAWLDDLKARRNGSGKFTDADFERLKQEIENG